MNKLTIGSTELFFKNIDEKEIESIKLITEGTMEPYLHVKKKKFTGFNKTEHIIKGIDNIKKFLEDNY